MKADWGKCLVFYLDPQIRSVDKDLFKHIIADIEDLNAGWSELPAQGKRDDLLPATFLLASDTDLEPKIEKDDKTLLFGDANMSIFGKKEFDGENFPLNSLEDWRRFLGSIDKVYGHHFQKVRDRLLDDSLSLLSSLSLRLLKQDVFPGPSHSADAKKVEEGLLAVLSFEELREALPKLTEERFGVHYDIRRAPDARSRSLGSLPLDADGEIVFLCWKEETGADRTLWLYSLLEDVLAGLRREKDSEESLEDMRRIVSELPLPLALFNSNRELVLHNALFIKLNLSAKSCLALENESQFPREGELYRIKRKILERGHELFVFVPVRQFLNKSSSPSSEELGIISSSIAHELNNPLGGVSGALDVVLLDEHPEETKQGLLDMKAGVARCKKLVETFLGFSKLEAGKNNGDFERADAESCLNSAMELIRFRLIENNVSMEAKFSKSEGFEKDFNPHVLSMTLYLILGELLTNFGRRKLVSEERSANFQISFREDRDSLTFSWEGDLSLGGEFFKSKLFGHLLEIQGLMAESLAGKAILRRS